MTQSLSVTLIKYVQIIILMNVNLQHFINFRIKRFTSLKVERRFSGRVVLIPHRLSMLQHRPPGPQPSEGAHPTLIQKSF